MDDIALKTDISHGVNVWMHGWGKAVRRCTNSETVYFAVLNNKSNYSSLNPRVFQNLSLRLIQGFNLSQCQNLQKHLETMFFITCACWRGELLTNVIALFLFATETSSVKSQLVHAGCERHRIGSSLPRPSQLALLADTTIFHAKFL